METFNKQGLQSFGGGASCSIAFTLAEMMVVMLIMSIALACMAPVMTTKMKADRERALANTSPWNWAQNNTDAYYGLEALQTAMIGQDTKGVGEDAKLIIHNNDASVRDMILFKHNGNVLGRLRLNGNSLLLGSLTAGTELGTDTVAIGRNINASADSSTAIGRDAVASGDNSMALGVSAQAQVEKSLSVGNSSGTEGSGALAIGWRAKAKNNGSIAIGSYVNTYLNDGNYNPVYDNGENSIAIGTNSWARGNDTIAIGNGVRSGTQTGTIAIGSNVNAVGDAPNTVIGYGAMGNRPSTWATASRNTVIGYGAAPVISSGANNVIIGDNAASTLSYGEHNVIIGNDAAAWTHSVVIGSGAATSATVGNGITIGYNAKSESSGILIGTGTTLKGTGTPVAIGGSADGWDAIAIGGSVTGDSPRAVAIGGKASAISSIAIGTYLTKAKGKYSIAIGDQAEAEGEGAIAIGRFVNAYGENCIVIGNNISTSYSNTITLASDVRVSKDLYVNNTKIASDRRLKYVGKEFTSGLEKIRQIKSFNYTFKDDDKKTPRVGVIAQDLKKIFPNAVSKGADGFFSIRMEDMFYAVINAVKELDSRVSRLEKENKELRARLEKLEAKLK